MTRITEPPRRGAGPPPEPHRPSATLLGDDDLHLFNEGSHVRLYEKLGAHPLVHVGERGTYFAVWAPNAEEVSVIGDFNGWTRRKDTLAPRASSGIWEGFLTGVEPGALYKYHIRSRERGYTVDKADPFGFAHETPPRTASVVTELGYEWGDQEWMRARKGRFAHDAPVSVYELHLGSWRRPQNDPQSFLSYREVAEPLANHVLDAGFTHVQFLPLMEHPFYGSWGYQITGYFAPTARYGKPQDLMHLIDHLHQRGIGVILDWVPSHFPNDEHGLGWFDGSHLYEHEDPREGFHPDWNSWIFNYGRHEVRSFLLSSAHFWLDRYHADGLRVDAVASMLYRDYSRKHGEWIPNQYGGRENLEAIGFLRRLSEDVYKHHPDVQTVAEESTAWPMVSRPTYVGGLGFGLKWDMGWMHDTLAYFSRDAVHRAWHHHELTFRNVYAFTENFMLPLSHDEVVHGKGSLIGRMPGDDWQKRANLKALFGYMYAQPGKKLLFMGGEIAQWSEWSHEGSVQWHLLEHAPHRHVFDWVRDLNRLYRNEPALHAQDFHHAGFEWVEGNDWLNSVYAFLRKSPDAREVLAVFNLTPMARHNYRVGVSRAGFWEELLNSDAVAYGGDGRGNLGGVHSAPVPYHDRFHSLNLYLPPLSALFFRAPTPHP